MSNKLVPINNKMVLNKEYSDHLIASIEEYRKMNGSYPKEIIMNEEMGKHYFDYFQNGVPMHAKYKDTYMMSFTVNTRFRASTIFMK